MFQKEKEIIAQQRKEITLSQPGHFMQIEYNNLRHRQPKQQQEQQQKISTKECSPIVQCFISLFLCFLFHLIMHKSFGIGSIIGFTDVSEI